MRTREPDPTVVAVTRLYAQGFPVKSKSLRPTHAYDHPTVSPRCAYAILLIAVSLQVNSADYSQTGFYEVPDQAHASMPFEFGVKLANNKTLDGEARVTMKLDNLILAYVSPDCFLHWNQESRLLIFEGTASAGHDLRCRLITLPIVDPGERFDLWLNVTGPETPAQMTMSRTIERAPARIERGWIIVILIAVAAYLRVRKRRRENLNFDQSRGMGLGIVILSVSWLVILMLRSTWMEDMRMLTQYEYVEATTIDGTVLSINAFATAPLRGRGVRTGRSRGSINNYTAVFGVAYDYGGELITTLATEPQSRLGVSGTDARSQVQSTLAQGQIAIWVDPDDTSRAVYHRRVGLPSWIFTGLALFTFWATVKLIRAILFR